MSGTSSQVSNLFISSVAHRFPISILKLQLICKLWKGEVFIDFLTPLS